MKDYARSDAKKGSRPGCKSASGRSKGSECYLRYARNTKKKKIKHIERDLLLTKSKRHENFLLEMLRIWRLRAI